MPEKITLPRSVSEAVTAEREGSSLDYLFFWGPHPSHDGSAGPGCLSQWWPASFSLDGYEYASAEHAMMAQKAFLFDDQETARNIFAAEEPAEAKRLGRTVRNFDEDVWGEHRFDIVVRGNVAKFQQNPELLAYLRSTSGQVLVEASPHDRIWGIGLDAADERAASASTWLGLNLLGFALVTARELLSR
jgi:ribA/ribD-fused uncharacterized protein